MASVQSLSSRPAEKKVFRATGIGKDSRVGLIIQGMEISKLGRWYEQGKGSKWVQLKHRDMWGPWQREYGRTRQMC